MQMVTKWAGGFLRGSGTNCPFPRAGRSWLKESGVVLFTQYLRVPVEGHRHEDTWALPSARLLPPKQALVKSRRRQRTGVGASRTVCLLWPLYPHFAVRAFISLGKPPSLSPRKGPVTQAWPPRAKETPLESQRLNDQKREALFLWALEG